MQRVSTRPRGNAGTLGPGARPRTPFVTDATMLIFELYYDKLQFLVNYRLGMKYWPNVSVRICSRPQNIPIQLPYSWFGSVQTFEIVEIELQTRSIKIIMIT